MIFFKILFKKFLQRKNVNVENNLTENHFIIVLIVKKNNFIVIQIQEFIKEVIIF